MEDKFFEIVKWYKRKKEFIFYYDGEEVEEPMDSDDIDEMAEYYKNKWNWSEEQKNYFITYCDELEGNI
jgi:hypothetical protein